MPSLSQDMNPLIAIRAYGPSQDIVCHWQEREYALIGDNLPKEQFSFI
jgi:hypothetical protein